MCNFSVRATITKDKAIKIRQYELNHSEIYTNDGNIIITVFADNEAEQRRHREILLKNGCKVN